MTLRRGGGGGGHNDVNFFTYSLDMAHNFTYPDFSLIWHGFPTTLAKGVWIIEGPL